MADLHEDYYTFLNKIVSSYHAISLSVTSPVIVPFEVREEVRLPNDKLSVFSQVFYDVENEDENMKIMERRIERGGEYIRQHIGSHEQMKKCFNRISLDILMGNRKKLFKDVGLLTMEMFGYGELVESHNDFFKGESFLYYPTCLEGHFFYMPGFRLLESCIFNPTQTHESFIEDVESLNFLVKEIAFDRNHFPELEIPELKEGEGSMIESSLVGKLNLTKELLNRAGYKPAFSIGF